MQSTNFFSLLNHLLKGADISITASKIDEDRIAVSILPKLKVQDDVKERIAPIVLRGTPEQIDTHLFEHIKKPLEASNEFAVDLSAFEAQMEEAKKLNAKAKKEKEEREKQEKKADEIIKKSEELLKEKKYDEAVAEAQKAVDKLPDYKKAEKNLAEVKKQAGIHNQASLFDMSPSTEPTPTARVQNNDKLAEVVSTVQEAVQQEGKAEADTKQPAHTDAVHSNVNQPENSQQIRPATKQPSPFANFRG